MYIDDMCFISPRKHKINTEIKSLEQNYDVTNYGNLMDCLGTRSERHKDVSVTFTQLRMMERGSNIVGIDHTCKNVKLCDTPASSDCILGNVPD